MLQFLRSLTTYQAVVTILVIALFSGGCEEKSSEKKTATLIYIAWSEGIAYSHLAKSILEKKMGYEVTLASASLEAGYEAVANGEADAFMESWLPVLHKPYYRQNKDKLINLGAVYKDTRSGLVVPSYVSIDSIAQLRKVKERFRGKIYGIEDGAGIMKTTRTVMDRYNLDYRLVSSSDAVMTAALKRAIEDREWIVITGWKPHWIFGKWDLKFLRQDPDKRVWFPGNIHILGRQSLKKEMPELAQFLSNYSFTDDQLYDLMFTVQERQEEKDILEITDTWMTNHTELVQSWIPNN